jgi:transcription elongation factor
VPVHVLRVVIGSVAGVVLSVILVQQGVVDLVGNDGANKSISIAVLALLGGFSGTLVYRVIQRLISVIESLITEDPRAVVERTEREVNAKAAVATAETQKADVDKLQTVLSQLGTNPAAAEAELRKLIQDKGGAPALSTMERRQEMLKTGVAALKPESDPQVAEAEPEPPKAPDEGAQSRT